MKKKMMTTTPLASPAEARRRMPTGAFAGPAVRAFGFSGGQGRDLVTTVNGDVCVAYTPAIVDVVTHDDFPGVRAWSPPV